MSISLQASWRGTFASCVSVGLALVLVAGCGAGPDAADPEAPTSARSSASTGSTGISPPSTTSSPDPGVPTDLPPSTSTPVLPGETAEDFAARAFGISDEAGRSRSCVETQVFYRDFLLPVLAAALARTPEGCGAGEVDARFSYRVLGLRPYDPASFYPDPIPAQALAPLTGADQVLRVDLAGATDEDFASFWLVVGRDDRFYLYHPVLFQITTCFDERFRLLPGAPAWCR